MPLVAVLVWAVALMHSLPAGAERKAPTAAIATEGHASCCPAPMTSADGMHGGNAGGEPTPGHGSHDLTHLCLAILTGLVVGVLGIALSRSWWVRHARATAGLRYGERTPARPPPRPAGRTLLNFVCVLRA